MKVITRRLNPQPDSPGKKGLIRNSIRASTYALICSAAFMGMTVDYVIPYALFLGSSTAVVGVLASVPVFIGALAQLKSAAAARRIGRKKLCVIMSILHGILWLPVIATAFLPPAAGIPMFAVLFTLLTVAGSFEIPVWSGMLADLVPPGKRGSFFGWRMSVLGFVHIGCSAAAAFILSAFRGINPALGFGCIFLLAALFRSGSSYFVSRMHDKSRKEPFVMFPFLNFLRGFRRSNFARFTVFQAAMNFSFSLSGPYFAVYMLRELEFSYVNYMAVILAGTITMFSLSRRWGAQADDAGNIRIVKLVSLLMPLIPVLWMFSPDVLYLIGVQVFSGFLWSGYMIASSNFIFDAVTPAKRACAIAYFNVVNGSAVCAGALLGGVLIDALPGFWPWQGIQAVFLLSGVLRLLFRIFLARGISEVRTARTVPAVYLFTYVGGIRPLLGFTRGAQRVMRRIFSA